MKRQRLFAIWAVLVISSFRFESVRGGDWPQILGPNRNGIAIDEKLADGWPGGKPTKVWDVRVGSGYAGAVVSGDVTVLFHRESGKDLLTAFNSTTGKKIWTKDFPTTFRPQVGGEDGPLATPTIHEGSIYAYSPQGGLYCVDLISGEKRWERKTHKEFGAEEGYFGAGCSPLVEGKLVIVNVGGRKKNSGVVAFHCESGQTAWSSVSDDASYAAPIATTIDGTRHVLCITRLHFISLDPETGTERFRIRFGQTGPTVNGANPIVLGNNVLLTASYGIGARWLELSKSKVDVVWDDEIVSSQYTTPIFDHGLVYALDGRFDLGDRSLKCIDPKTRKELWSKPGVKYSTLIAADGKLLIMQTDGTLKLAKLSTDSYVELAAASLLSGTTRALPALANGRFYVRNENTLACFDLSK